MCPLHKPEKIHTQVKESSDSYQPVFSIICCRRVHLFSLHRSDERRGFLIAKRQEQTVIEFCIVQFELVLIDTLDNLVGAIQSTFVKENWTECLAICLSKLEKLDCWHSGERDVGLREDRSD